MKNPYESIIIFYGKGLWKIDKFYRNLSLNCDFSCKENKLLKNDIQLHEPSKLFLKNLKIKKYYKIAAQKFGNLFIPIFFENHMKILPGKILIKNLL